MKASTQAGPTLITGGCGYMGRQLCLRLLALGHSVWLIDDLSLGIHPDVWLKEAISERTSLQGHIVYRIGDASLPGAVTVTFVHADITEALSRKALQQREAGQSAALWPAYFAAVFHLASTEGDSARLAQNPLRVAHRLAIDGCLFAWAQAQGDHLGRLIYVSPQDTADPEGVLSIAADAGERLAALLHRHTGMAVACVRLATVYGKDQAAAHVVPLIAHSVLRADGTWRLPAHLLGPRDLLHVDDAIAGLLLASEHARDGRPITLGSGKLTLPQDIALRMAQQQGRPLTIQAPAATPRPAHPAVGTTTGAQDAAALRFAPKVQMGPALTQVLQTAERREQRLAQAKARPLS